MGKWIGLRGKYPDLPRDDAITAEVDALVGVDREVLTQEIDRLEEEKTRLEACLKDVKFDLEVYETALLRDMRSSRLDSFTSDGRSWSMGEEPHPRVLDRTANVEWAQRYDPSVLSIQWQSLKALVKLALEHPESNEMPEGIEIYRKPVLHRRKA